MNLVLSCFVDKCDKNGDSAKSIRTYCNVLEHVLDWKKLNVGVKTRSQKPENQSIVFVNNNPEL